MKKNLLFSLFFLLIFSINSAAQTTEKKMANPADAASIDAIIKSVYDVISGDAGQKRDWDRFRALFHPSARMIAVGRNPQTGVVMARGISPDEYIQRNEPFFEKEGFHEREIAKTTEIYGNIAHVFSTYEAFKTLSDKKPFMRGINSFQLLNDGKRWWVMTIYWQSETPDNQIPKKYLKSRN